MTANKNNVNLIIGDPKKAIRKLSVPMMVSMLLIMTYNLADSIWVAGLGVDALAALGFITPLFLIIIGLGNGIGSGANSFIARSIGAKNKKQADNTALHAIVLTIILSIVTPLLMLPLLKNILLIMGAGTAIDLALDYGYITFIFIFVFLFSGVASSILRSEGDVNRVMYAMAITAILNTVIDPIFIYTFNLGISGAAWATVVSAAISCLVMIYWMWFKKDTYLDLSPKAFKYKFNIVIEILKVAIPSTAESLVMSLLSIIMNSLLVIVAGTTAVAVYTSGWRIVSLALIPHMGLGTALLTVAGAAYGAKNYKKLSIAFNYVIKMGLLMSVIMSIIIYIFAPQLTLIFSYSSESASLAPKLTAFLKTISLYVLTLPIGVIASSTFQGLGKGFSALTITFVRQIFGTVMVAYILGIILNFGEVGVWWGTVLGGGLGCILGGLWVKLHIKSLNKKIIIKH